MDTHEKGCVRFDRHVYTYFIGFEQSLYKEQTFKRVIGTSLTMPNKKYFFDFLLLKIFTGYNVENFS